MVKGSKPKKYVKPQQKNPSGKKILDQFSSNSTRKNQKTSNKIEQNKEKKKKTSEAKEEQENPYWVL